MSAEKVAVVTGGGSGIGRAVATRFAKLGYRVCLMDLDKEKLTKTNEEINRISQGLAVTCDVSNHEAVKNAFEYVHNNWSRLDVVFANAGISGVLSPIETMDVQSFENTIDINLKGTFNTVKNTIPFMKKHGGSIIITSSVSGNRVFSQSGFSAYSSSKAAQVAFMKMAALELANYKIRVNAICPGGIKTSIGDSMEKSEDLKNVAIPIKFPEGDKPLEHGPGKPEQVADLVEFLASTKAAHISGTEIYIDGAESLIRG